MHNSELVKLILSLVDPEYPNNIKVSELLKKRDALKSAIRLARRNGLYHSLLLKLKESNIDSSFLEEDLDREKRRLEEFKKTIVLLNSISKDSGLDYILIKACTTVPHIPRDIDILVHSEDKRRVRQGLESAGMKCTHSNQVETSLEKRGFMPIDIYTGISYITVNFIDNTFLWQSRIEDEVFGVKYPGLNNEANFLLSLIHDLFGHREITLLDYLHLKTLMTNLNVDICRNHAYQKGWGSTFDLVLNELESFRRRIYDGNEVIGFPHLFGRRFILRCVSMVEGLDMKGSTKFFFNLSLLVDRVFHELKKLPLYHYGSSNFMLVRRLLNSFGYFVRSRSGDRESM